MEGAAQAKLAFMELRGIGKCLYGAVPQLAMGI